MRRRRQACQRHVSMHLSVRRRTAPSTLLAVDTPMLLAPVGGALASIASPAVSCSSSSGSGVRISCSCAVDKAGLRIERTRGRGAHLGFRSSWSRGDHGRTGTERRLSGTDRRRRDGRRRRDENATEARVSARCIAVRFHYARFSRASVK